MAHLTRQDVIFSLQQAEKAIVRFLQEQELEGCTAISGDEGWQAIQTCKRWEKLVKLQKLIHEFGFEDSEENPLKFEGLADAQEGEICREFQLARSLTNSRESSDEAISALVRNWHKTVTLREFAEGKEIALLLGTPASPWGEQTELERLPPEVREGLLSLRGFASESFAGRRLWTWDREGTPVNWTGEINFVQAHEK